MEIMALEGQSFLDIAIKECGSIQGVFDLAKENSLSITDVLYPGIILKIRTGDFDRKDIAKYYHSKQIDIATSIDYEVAEYILTERLPIIL